MNRMSQSAVALSILFVACVASIAAPPSTLLKMQPGPVTPAGPGVVAGTHEVTGSFTLMKDAQDGIASSGFGGACLVADFSATIGERACTTSTDCAPALQAFKDVAPAPATGEPNPVAGAFAYCLPTHAAGPKRCWIRPGSPVTHCNVSTTMARELNKRVELPDVPADPLKNGKRVLWIVHACLNAVPGGCAGTDPVKYKTWDSDPKTFPF